MAWRGADEDETPMMRFEINADDVDDEFEPGMTSRKRTRTKDDAIYGIFGEEQDLHQPRSKKARRAAKRPVAFVASGGDGKKKEPSKAADMAEVDRERTPERAGGHTPERVAPLGVGLGFGGGGGAGLGFDASQAPKPGEGLGFSGAPKREIKPKVRRKLNKREAREVGRFENHTKGIASKIMKKMGWVEGAGLGRNGEGIARPIEVKKRADPKAGIGPGEMTEQAKADFPQEPDSDEDIRELKKELKEIDVAQGSWRKDGAPQGRKRRPKPKAVVYKTAAEVAKQPTKQVIIDMTGASGPRKITSLDQVDEQFGGDVEDTKLPEMQYNLKLLVDYAEIEIQKVDTALRRQTEALSALSIEQDDLEEAVARDGGQSKRLGEILKIVDECNKRRTSTNPQDALTIPDLLDIFTNMKSKYYDEYHQYRVAELAEPLLFPLLEVEAKRWKPLAPPPSHDMDTSDDLGGRAALAAPLPAPNFTPQMFVGWRSLLECAPADGVCMYARLIEKIWMPRASASIVNEWNPRDCDTGLRLVEDWEKAIPSNLFQYMLHHLILPKLVREVDAWNPRLDRVRLHTWLHPWLPLLGTAMQPLYPNITHKLTTVLASWHPSDKSARAIIMPWAEVFNRPTLDGLLVRAVLPKLNAAMHEFVVNPANQFLEPFEAVMSWERLLSPHHLVALLEAEFFPKWTQVLYAWLSSTSPPPNFEEITQWYIGWKGLFPENVLNNDRVSAHFTAGLELINRALSDQDSLGSYVPPQAREALERMQAPPPEEHQQEKKPARTLSYMERVEAVAAENDIIMMPSNKQFQGKKIYNFGDVKIYIDSMKELVFVEHNGMWQLVDFEELMLLAMG